MKTPLPGQPLHRIIMGIDIVNSTSRNDMMKSRLRRIMYSILESALQASGITENYRDPILDRGDGALIFIHSVDEVPKTRSLDTLVPMLNNLLTAHNRKNPQCVFRLRVALHAGEVHYDENGAFGEAVDVTCRLLEADALKVWLLKNTEPLALVVSDHIYRSVVRQGYDGIDMHMFKQLVHVRVGDEEVLGWVGDSQVH